MTEADVSEQYDERKRAYEDRWKGYLRNSHDRLLEVLLPELNEQDTILDASCGTGLLAHKILEKEVPFQEYILNDISPRMLEIAQDRLPDDSRLSFTSHSAENLPFEENRFTKVICLNALHNYQHPSRAARQFKDVLKPNGKLYLLDWDRSGWFRFVNTLISLYDDQTISTMSLKEATRMLREHRYRIELTDQWRYRYWRLYLVVAGFQHWKSR